MIKYFSENGHSLKIAMPGDAGYDLPVKDKVIVSRAPTIVSTGIFLEMPVDMYASIVPRSSSATRRRLNVVTGTIDSGYRGEIKVVAYSIGWRSDVDDVKLEEGESIAQLIFHRSLHVDVAPVKRFCDLSTTPRGDGGFGSTYSDFYFNGKVWSETPQAAVARISRRGFAYNWKVKDQTGVCTSMSDAVTACMRALGVSERFV